MALTKVPHDMITGIPARNRIINGAMAIDQRNAGASQTITAGAALAYTVDRFYAYCTGANVTGQRVAGSNANQYRYQFTGAASVTKIGFNQRIEAANSYDLMNSTATLSVDLANSLLTTVTWVAYYATTTDTFGTLASPTRTQIATGTFTVDATVTNYSTNISIPSAAITGISVELSVAAQTSGTWTIGNVQLEKGSTATDFDYRPYGTELALCQRYYERFTASVTNGLYANGYSQTTAAARYSLPFKVTKRSAPTISVSLGTDFYGQTGTGANISTTTLSGSLATTSCVMLSAAFGGTSFTIGQGSVLLDNASGASWIAANIEL